MADKVKLQFKEMFDWDAIQKGVEKAEKVALSKWGAFVRTVAQRSMRKRKKSSPAGQPPSSHEGSLRRLIMFAYEPERSDVVVGPLLFGKHPAGYLLEEGGSIAIDGKVRTYKGNPFMRPARDYVNKNELPNIWKGSVK